LPPSAAVAGAQQCLDETIQYTQDRTAFGRPILKFQVWRHTFAELATQIEAARWLSYRAVDLFNRKQEAVKEITMAKLFAGELAIKVADRCVQAARRLRLCRGVPDCALLPRRSADHDWWGHQRGDERDHLQASWLGLVRKGKGPISPFQCEGSRERDRPLRAVRDDGDVDASFLGESLTLLVAGSGLSRSARPSP
jgi:alkylation response protein AidB-like acyl-CoA dehydrogenase